MATYNHEEHAAREMEKQLESVNSSPAKSIRRPLNDNVGYAEFIDESV
jgi:hypothetical protein